MKAEAPKKVEIMMNRKRFFVSEAAAKIAIDTMGATEVTLFDKPNELRIKPPPIIQPEYKKIVVPESIKPEPIKAQILNPEPINPKSVPYPQDEFDKMPDEWKERNKVAVEDRKPSKPKATGTKKAKK